MDHELHMAHLCFGAQLLLASWHCHFGRAGLHAEEGSTWMFSEAEHGKKWWKNQEVHKDAVDWISFSPSSPSNSTSEIIFKSKSPSIFYVHFLFVASLEFMPRLNGIIFLIVSRYKSSCSWWGSPNIQREPSRQKGYILGKYQKFRTATWRGLPAKMKVL